MKRGTIVAMAALGGALLVAGAYYAAERTRSQFPLTEIQAAQARSYWGAEPKWLGFTAQAELFKRVRARAYAYCLRSGRVSRECAEEQDGAVQFAILAVLVAESQRNMKEKNQLGRRERWVATNPDIARRVINTCWNLYKEHGAADARILSVCLGNLTDASPLTEMAVP